MFPLVSLMDNGMSNSERFIAVSSVGDGRFVVVRRSPEWCFSSPFEYFDETAGWSVWPSFFGEVTDELIDDATSRAYCSESVHVLWLNVAPKSILDDCFSKQKEAR